MKQECPKCSSSSHYLVEEAQSPNYEFSNSIKPLTLTADMTAASESGFFGKSYERQGVHMSARVCASCGYIEWYAKDLDLLQRFAENGEGGVRRVEGEEP